MDRGHGAGSGMTRPYDHPVQIRETVALVAVGVAAALAVAVHVNPRRVDSIAREDGLIEWISAGGAAFACVTLLRTALRHRRWARLAMCGAAAAMFVVAGEEVSWFQRILGYGTPSALEANSQGESNLHNLSTDFFQIAYYVAASVVLVVLPYLARWTLPARSALHGFVPGPVPAVLASLSVVFTYARSGHVAHQATLCIAVAVLLLWTGGRPAAWAVATATTVVLGYVLVLSGGESLARPWAPAEYREMFTAVGFAAAALEMARRTAAVEVGTPPVAGRARSGGLRRSAA